jgi:lipopolysaccharide export system protein LptA
MNERFGAAFTRVAWLERPWRAARGMTSSLARREDIRMATGARRRAAMAMAMAFIVLSLTASTPAANAQGIDLTQGGPIQITAKDGIEWRQAEQMVIARGDAKAVRGNVTVTSDRLIAWYRRKGGDATATQAGATQPGTPQPVSTGVTGDTETEGNEVYRMRAEGNVHIYTETDQAWGDQATYDLDQAVLVMTGGHLKLTTPNDTLTARDTLEYWSQKHMAVARGGAVIVTNDARRISADTLVAYTVDQQAHPAGASAPAANTVKPAGNAAQPAPPPDSMAAMAGKLQRVEAFGDVSVRTATDIVTGDRGVYVPDTDIAHLGGHVRISRGENQVNGSEAVVNMKTGVATLLAGDTGRVNGLVVPNDRSNPTPGDDALTKPAPGQPTSGQPTPGQPAQLQPKPGGTP